VDKKSLSKALLFAGKRYRRLGVDQSTVMVSLAQKRLEGFG
jgi:hypothetical protein